MSLLREEFHKLCEDVDALENQCQQAVLIFAPNAVDEMREHGERRRWWSQMAAMARFDAESLDDQRKLAFSDARERVRGQHEKISEKRIDDLATLDPLCQQALAACRASEMIAEKLEGVVRALDARERMLQSMNSRQVAEINSLPKS